MVELCRAPDLKSDLEQVVDTMIALTRLSRLDGAIIAGSESMEFYLSLRRRGFVRVTTSTTSRTARRHYSVGLIAARDTLAALGQASAFLAANAAVAILVEASDGQFCMKVRERLQQLGFRIEAGVRCHRGLVLSASRQGYAQMAAAA
ncbi:hypothetical protein [Bradyrhizobium sp. Tv2a-2]|uniref:hypothetical protein n=1 Tax=Bradyrhizobium sp. Tv2a-2 TaxID=113395 RepID=UPI000463F2B3|nr:hypothetical protein [Bradyrhizobium sp. Tv2a-2]